MANVDFDQLNARLRKRLEQLRQHQDPAERLRLLKRYLSHFVKLVQAGRHFEVSFGEHLRLVVLYLNDRREQPLEEETLGTIVKTLCVICCITCASHHTVMIALHGLLDIFERISCKETLAAIEYCGNHFKKLIAQFKRFGYYKIERQLVELVYITSLSFNKAKERKDYVLELGKPIGGSWEKLLRWKSIAVEKEVRIFINDLQDRYPLFSAYSVPIEDCQIGEYRLEQPRESTGLWLDVNFKPATIRLAGCLTLVRGTNRLEMNVGLEIDHRNVSQIELKKENDNHLLSIKYEMITVEPEVLKVEKKGSLTVTIAPSFDWNYLVKEVIPEVRLKVDCEDDSEPPNTTNIEGLLNVSLLESVASGPANNHNFDHSPRLRDNRDAIEQHRNMRCQMLDTVSSAGSNKENMEPQPSVSDVRVVLQDVQRLRVFEPLQQECQQRRLSRGAKPSSPGKRNQREETVDPHLNEGKKRKLFDKQTVSDVLNDSVDSQLQRNKYVEKKLINTVKPIQTIQMDVKPLVSVPATESFQNISDQLNESSATENMSSEEFEQSLQAYIDNNGIFGIAQQKVLDKKLEKNIRKINQMVDRSTKKFFKREPAADNPYDFVDSEGNRKSANKQSTRKGANSARKRKPKANNENASPKASKNAANQSLRNKNSKNATKVPSQTPSKPPADPIPPRTSLPRSKKPVLIVDLSSDSEPEEAVEIGTTFQNLDISSIAAADGKPKPRIPVAKQLFAKSTPVDNAKSKKRPLDRTYAAEVPSKTQNVPNGYDRISALPAEKPEHEEAIEIVTTFQNSDISSIAAADGKPKPRIPIAKQLFAKSTPVENAKSKKRPLDRTYAVEVPSKTQNVPNGDDRSSTLPAKKQRVPLLELGTEGNNKSGVFIRRDYKKQHLPAEMQQRVSALLEREKEKAPSPAPSIASSRSDDTQISMQIPTANVQSSNAQSSLTKAMLLKYQNSISESSIPQSLEVNTSSSKPVSVQAKPKPSIDEPAVSNFNMNYAKNRYTLKKFISNNDKTFIADEEAPAHLDTNQSPNDGNQTILSDEIRAGCDNAVPPSLPDDDASSDLQFVDSAELVSSPQAHYPTTPKAEPTREKPRNDPEARENDKHPSQTAASGGEGNQTRTQETIVPNDISKASAALTALMLNNFKTRTHEELDPSLTEFETKVEKLDQTIKSFELHLSKLRNEEFDRKCEEILELENKLDEKHNELVKLSLDSLERFDQAAVTSKKLARYVESKVNYFKEQIQSARQEMPVIVDETIKSVWNEQVQARRDQMEILMAKMMM